MPGLFLQSMSEKVFRHIPDWGVRCSERQKASVEDLKAVLSSPHFSMAARQGRPKRIVPDAIGHGYEAVTPTTERRVGLGAGVLPYPKVEGREAEMHCD